jgi:hypothetical protein
MLTGDVRKVITRIMSIAQDQYPETMAQTIIINAPVSFRLVWAAIKPLLQPRTQNKIKLLGTKYLEDLVKHVEPKNLPAYMGGECKSTLLEDVGPWNDEATLMRLNHVPELPGSEGGFGEEVSDTPGGSQYTEVASKTSEKMTGASNLSETLLPVRSCLQSKFQSVDFEHKAPAKCSMLKSNPSNTLQAMDFSP